MIAHTAELLYRLAAVTIIVLVTSSNPKKFPRPAVGARVRVVARDFGLLGCQRCFSLCVKAEPNKYY